ncbi:MAG: solute carrier family 23 protein [Burkholderiales bacterium]
MDHKRPGAGPLVVLTLQHTVLVLVLMVYPLAVAQAIHLDSLQTSTLIVGTILASAVATAMQVARTPWGSGQLGVYIPTPLHLSALIFAGTGGLAMIAGYALILCACQLLISRLLPALRVCFPAEVCGVVVIGLGMSITPTALMQVTGASSIRAETVQGLDLAVAVLTLITIIAATLFNKGRFRLVAVGAGLLVGSIVGGLYGLIAPADLAQLQSKPWLGLPSLGLAVPEFNMAIVPIAIVLALINSIDNLGVQVGIQRLVNPDWRQVDLQQGAGSVRANAVGDGAAGLLAGMPVGLSSAHVGLMFATRTTARILAPATALLLVVLVFMPKIIAVLELIPRPVIGALLVYTAGCMIVDGMQLTQSRLLSDRRRLTVGLSLVAGLLPLILPGLGHGLPPMFRPIYESSLSVAAIVAVSLTLLFRLGIRSQNQVPSSVDLFDFDQIAAYFNDLGQQWGARRNMIGRATRATAEAVEALGLLGVSRAEIQCDAQFDEDILEIVLNYRGPRLDCPELRPSVAGLDDAQHLVRMAGHLVRQMVDRLTQTEQADGLGHRIVMRFED